MGPIDQIVNVSISAQNATPQLPNFGTPAFYCHHTHNTDRIRSYTSISSLTDDGYSATEPAYYMAQAWAQQNPTTTSFKVIRCTTAVQMTFTYKLTSTNVGDKIGFTCVGVNGTTTEITTTCTGVKATDIHTLSQLTPPNGSTMADDGTDTLTLTVTSSGKMVFVSDVLGGNYTDTTGAISTIAADLTAARNVDDTWYGITGEHMDATNIAATAAWAESNKKFHFYTTADTVAKGAGTGIGNTLKTSAYSYSYGQWSGSPIHYAATALESQRFTATPGSDTYAFKTTAGVPVDSLTPTEITNLAGNRLNYYIAVAGLNITLNGINASGIYADLRRGIDALAAQIQIQVFNLIASQPKVPFDPTGIASVGAEVASALQQFTATKSNPAALLRGDPGYAPQVILPDIANTTALDRGNRILRNVQFTAYAQNAIQTVFISGTVNI